MENSTNISTASLAGMPLDILYIISDNLGDIVDRWALQFSCKTIQSKLEYKRDHKATNRRRRTDHLAWLHRLVRDLPYEDVCDACGIIHSPLEAWRGPERIDRPCQRDLVDTGAQNVGGFRMPVLIVKALLRRHQAGMDWEWLTPQPPSGRDVWTRPLYAIVTNRGLANAMVKHGRSFYNFYINKRGEVVLETVSLFLRTMGPEAIEVDRDPICPHVDMLGAGEPVMGEIQRCEMCLVEYGVHLCGFHDVQGLMNWHVQRQITWNGAVLLRPNMVSPWHASQLRLGDISGSAERGICLITNRPVYRKLVEDWSEIQSEEQQQQQQQGDTA